MLVVIYKPFSIVEKGFFLIQKCKKEGICIIQKIQ